MLRTIVQELIIFCTKPYISRELLGWGPLYSTLIGSYKRDWMWRGARTRLIRDKTHGYQHLLDISNWADRSTFFLDRWYDLPTQLIVKHMVVPGDTVLDIGANRGMFALCASRTVGINGRVICFEPNPAVARQIAMSMTRNTIANIEIREYGLSDADETLTLFIPDVNSGEASFAANDYATSQQLQASVRIGDDVIGNTDPAFIKIDVEGFEERTLRGLSQTIAKAKPLVLAEIIEAKLAAAGSSLLGIEGLLKPLGYEGRRIGLVKNGGVYKLSLSQDISGASFDMLWFPRDGASFERIRPFLN